MKRVLRYFILLIIIMIFPLSVSAEVIESDMTSVNSKIDSFEVGRISVINVGCTRYINMNNTGKKGFTITGSVVNGYTRDVELELSLNIFDNNGTLIDNIVSKISVPAKGKGYYREKFYEENVDYLVSDVGYFSIEAEITTDVEIIEKAVKDTYYLEKYDVKVNVNENNVFNVEEIFSAKYKSYITPIEKGISFRHRYIRSDGTKINKRAVISDIVLDDYYKISTEEGIRLLTIGKEDRSKGEKYYKINYNYNVGKDTYDGKDEFVYYLVSNYNVKVDGVTFEITMPKSFDPNNIKFIDSNGIEIENVKYEVNGNIIIGSISGIINPGVSYAIRIDLEDNYFIDESTNISNMTIVSYIVPIAFMLFAIIVLFVSIKNKQKKVYESLYFNEKINSLELGYLYNGVVKDNDIASLIFCLANKGYIKIVKEKNKYKILKLKDYIEDDRVEKAFMKEFFFDKEELVRKDFIVNAGEVKESINLKLDNKQRKNKIFVHNILNYKLLFWILVFIIIVINTINILIEYQPSVIFVNAVVCGIGYMILLNSVIGKHKPIERMLLLLVALIFIVSPLMLTSYKAFMEDILNTIAYVVGLFSMLVIACIADSMSNRTSYGMRMLMRIASYKNYLITCNDKVIEKECKKNKNLVYDVLPYTLVLGISDKWISRFENIEVEKPEWYECEEFKLEKLYEDVKDIYSDIFIGLKNNENKKDNI